MNLTHNARIWVIVGKAWVPAIVLAIRSPGMKASDVQPPGNNGKHTDIGPWVEEVCRNTTDAGAMLLSFPEGDAERHWRVYNFPGFEWRAVDPRIWDIWDAAHCAEEGSKPLATLEARQIMDLSLIRDGGEHPVFLRPGKFCKVVGRPGYTYNLCTVREA